jgi:hypothetical protein
MAIQYSVGVRDARNNAIESTVGASAKLQIWTGSAPANCATAASGTKLVEMTLPSDWMAASSSGAVAKSGTWTGTGITNGTAGYFRIVDNAGTTCHVQGTVTATGGGGDLTLDNVSIAVSQVVTLSTFSITASGA